MNLVGRDKVRHSRLSSKPLDAIIVPAARSAQNLAHAARLARATNTWLIVLCSKKTKVEEAILVLDAHAVARGVAVTIDPEYEHPFTSFFTSDVGKVRHTDHEDSDLSLKRNIGLLLALTMRWHRILFLDDDIRSLDSHIVGQATGLLNDYTCAGFRVAHFPDNSVVCHANRDFAQGRRPYRQDVFIGGSALALHCSYELSFIPHNYNEDWFFLFDEIVHGRAAVVGDVRQTVYDPYKDPGRAESEEFGDILAEGLPGKLHMSNDVDLPNRLYWTEFLEIRQRLLSEVRDSAEAASAEAAVTALEAACTVHQSLEGVQCVEFLALWRSDLQRWRQQWRTIRTRDSLGAVLSNLGFTPSFASAGRKTLCDLYYRDNSDATRIAVVDDERLLRRLRLAALQESGEMFSSDYATEMAWPIEIWSEMLRASAWYCAWRGDTAVGLAGMMLEPGCPSWERHIKSMWVHPRSRGLGIGSQMIFRMANDARLQGARRLTLWVFNVNPHARAFYERVGFRATGRKQPLPNDIRGRSEERMSVELVASGVALPGQACKLMISLDNWAGSDRHTHRATLRVALGSVIFYSRRESLFKLRLR